MSNTTYKKKHFEQWLKDKSINPLTNRKIKLNGPTYKKIEKLYNKYKSSIPPKRCKKCDSVRKYKYLRVSKLPTDVIPLIISFEHNLNTAIGEDNVDAFLTLIEYGYHGEDFKNLNPYLHLMVKKSSILILRYLINGKNKNYNNGKLAKKLTFDVDVIRTVEIISESKNMEENFELVDTPITDYDGYKYWRKDVTFFSLLYHFDKKLSDKVLKFKSKPNFSIYSNRGLLYETPFSSYESSTSFRYDYLEQILSNGIDPNIMRNKDHLLFDIRDLKVMKVFFKYGVKLDIRNSIGQTLLFTNYNKCIIEYLLQEGLDPNLQDKNNNTALMTACGINVRLLLEHGAKPDIVNNKNETVFTPILKSLKSPTVPIGFFKKYNSCRKILNPPVSLYTLERYLLLNKYSSTPTPLGDDIIKNLNNKDHYGYTPLMKACFDENIFLVESLIKLKVELEVRDEKNVNSINFMNYGKSSEISKTSRRF